MHAVLTEGGSLRSMMIFFLTSFRAERIDVGSGVLTVTRYMRTELMQQGVAVRGCFTFRSSYGGSI